MCAKRLALPKVKITPEMQKTHNELKAFLKRNPEIESKQLRPYGHYVSVNTIPKHLVEEFLSIVNKK